MKKYGKETTKLLQIRLSSEEYVRSLEFIKRFGTTRREVWLAILNNETDLRAGKFYKKNSSFKALD